MDEKENDLRDAHALNPHPESVRDELFRSGRRFFDSRDMVQVKYEMLRRADHDGVPVSQSAQEFGLSRPCFYQAKADFETGGLPGLLPEKPGPRHAHKLTDEVLAIIEGWLQEKSPPRTKEIALRLSQQLGVEVHPRSIERGLGRLAKKGHSK